MSVRECGGDKIMGTTQKNEHQQLQHSQVFRSQKENKKNPLSDNIIHYSKSGSLKLKR